MSQPVPLAVAGVRNLIREAEAKADESLVAKLDLMRQMLRVRQTEDVPSPHVGQDGMIRLARAIHADVTSQNDLFRTHNALTKAAHAIWAGFPHDDDTPDYVEDPAGRSRVA